MFWRNIPSLSSGLKWWYWVQEGQAKGKWPQSRNEDVALPLNYINHAFPSTVTSVLKMETVCFSETLVSLASQIRRSTSLYGLSPHPDIKLI
jgi:hypothetical protein